MPNICQIRTILVEPAQPDIGALIPLGDAPAAAKIVSAASRWKSGEINPAMIRRFDQRFGGDAIVSQYVRLFKELMNQGE